MTMYMYNYTCTQSVTVSYVHPVLVQCIVGVYSGALTACFNSSPPVPQPSVTLTGDIVTVNSPATLRCTVTLYQSVDCSQVTVSLQLIGSTLMPGSSCSYDFTLPATMSSNAGSYQCRATITIQPC